MPHTNSRWHFVADEDSYFTLIDGWLFQSVPWNNGNMSAEFWRVDVPSLNRREQAKAGRIMQKLMRLP